MVECLTLLLPRQPFRCLGTTPFVLDRRRTPSKASFPASSSHPASGEAVGAVLEWASREKLCVLVRGSGTKLGWGPAPRQVDVLISTARAQCRRRASPRRPDGHHPGRRDARRASIGCSRQHRQWIPLDPPSADRATIGGLVATNDSGPRRHRYGAPRDLIIGIEFARADGRLAKGGGIVVKNVAGYDLPRLLTGSFGSLGVIVTATFKLYPLTAASRTLVVELSSPSDLGLLAVKLSASHLTPTALEFATHPLRLIIRFESIEASVAQQSETAAKLIAENGYRTQTLSRIGGRAVLAGSRARLADDDRGALVKVSVLPTDLAETFTVIERLAGKRGYIRRRPGGRRRVSPSSDRRSAVAEARHRRPARCAADREGQRRGRERPSRAEGARRCLGADWRRARPDEGGQAAVRSRGILSPGQRAGGAVRRRTKVFPFTLATNSSQVGGGGGGGGGPRRIST